MIQPHHLQEVFKQVHGVELSTEDCELLLEHLDSKIVEIDPDTPQGNRILGMVAGAAVGLAASFIPGVNVALAISIGLTVFSLVNQLLAQQKDDDQSIPTAYISTGAPLAQLNSPVPIIYGERGGNGSAFGGVRVEPPLVNAWLENETGVQYLNQIFCLSVGTLGAIDEAETLVNDQDIEDIILASEFTLTFYDGTQTSQVIDYVTQIISPSVNNDFGSRKVVLDKDLKFVSGTTWVADSEEDYALVAAGFVYQVYETDDILRVTGKDNDALEVTFDNTTPGPEIDNDDLYIVADASYITSRPVEELEFFFRTNLWARQKDNDLREMAVCFDLSMTIQGSATGKTFIGRFAMRGKVVNGDNRSIRIVCPVKAIYEIDFENVLVADNTTPIYLITDADDPTTLNIEGYSLTYFSGGTISDSELNGIISRDDVSQRSTDNAAPVKITGVNERLTANLNYEGFAMIQTRVQATDRFDAEPRWSFLVTQGRLVDNLLLTGTTEDTDRVTSTTIDFTTEGILSGDKVWNLETGSTYTADVVSSGEVTMLGTPSFTIGDRFLITRYQASSYFADILHDLLTNNRGGVANIIGIPGFAIDYPRLIAFRQFCETNNYYWNSVVQERTPIARWAAINAVFSLGLASQSEGLLSVIPEQSLPVSELFTPSNVVQGTYIERYLDFEEQARNQLNLKWSDGSDGRFQEVVSVFETAALVAAQEPADPQELDAKPIVDQQQAEDVGALALQSIKLQSKQVELESDIEEVAIAIGDIVGTAFPTTHFDLEASGEVIEVNGTQVRLSFDVDVNASFGAFKVGSTPQWNIPITVAADGWIETSTSGIEVGSPAFVGDSIEDRRRWRVVRVEPDPVQNTVGVSLLQWTPDLYTTTGITITHEAIARPTRYECVGGTCSATTDPLAPFGSLAECQATIVSGECGGWGFDSGLTTCQVETVADGGVYTTEAACLAALATAIAISDTPASNIGLIQDFGVNPHTVQLYTLQRTLLIAVIPQPNLTDGVTGDVQPLTLSDYEAYIDFTLDNSQRMLYPDTLRLWVTQDTSGSPPATNSTITVDIREDMPPASPAVFDSDTGWTEIYNQPFTSGAASTTIDISTTQSFAHVRIKCANSGNPVGIGEINLFGGYRLENGGPTLPTSWVPILCSDGSM